MGCEEWEVGEFGIEKGEKMRLQNKDSVMNLGNTSFRRKNLLDDYKVILQGITEQLEEWDTKNSSQMTFYQYVAKSGLIDDTFYWIIICNLKIKIENLKIKNKGGTFNEFIR